MLGIMQTRSVYFLGVLMVKVMIGESLRSRKWVRTGETGRSSRGGRVTPKWGAIDESGELCNFKINTYPTVVPFRFRCQDKRTSCNEYAIFRKSMDLAYTISKLTSTLFQDNFTHRHVCCYFLHSPLLSCFSFRFVSHSYLFFNI